MWPRALIFDLDGTLVETAPDLMGILNDILASHDRAPQKLADVRDMIGDGARKLLERGFMASGGWPDGVELEALFEQFMARYVSDPGQNSYVYEGLTAQLDAAKAAGVKLGVCTNKPQKPTDLLLPQMGLGQYFDVAIGGDALAVRKPDAGHLLAVLERLDVAPADAVMVGDSINDILVAKNAGVASIAVSFGYTKIPPRELGADVVIDHYDEFPEALAHLR